MEYNLLENVGEPLEILRFQRSTDGKLSIDISNFHQPLIFEGDVVMISGAVADKEIYNRHFIITRVYIANFDNELKIEIDKKDHNINGSTFNIYPQNIFLTRTKKRKDIGKVYSDVVYGRNNRGMKLSHIAANSQEKFEGALIRKNAKFQMFIPLLSDDISYFVTFISFSNATGIRSIEKFYVFNNVSIPCVVNDNSETETIMLKLKNNTIKLNKHFFIDEGNDISIKLDDFLNNNISRGMEIINEFGSIEIKKLTHVSVFAINTDRCKLNIHLKPLMLQKFYYKEVEHNFFPLTDKPLNSANTNLDRIELEFLDKDDKPIQIYKHIDIQMNVYFF